MQMLAVTFVIRKNEGLILPQRPSQRDPELIALKRRSRSHIKIIRGIKSVVTQKLISGTMQLVGTGLRDNDHLGAGTLTKFGAVCVAQHIEFPHRLYTDQLLAPTTRLHVIFCRARKFYTVLQKQVLLLTVSRRREVAP